jgi:hypothetical protein
MRDGLLVLLAVFAFFTIESRFVTAEDWSISAAHPDVLPANIPPRPAGALSGSQFAASILTVDPREREHVIEDELLRGNVPDFLRKLVSIHPQYQLPSGRSLSATIFVTPDYLAIGSNDDFLRIPMNLYTAETVAKRFGFILPTKKIVDLIYAQSAYHLNPQPMSAGPLMRTTEYYRTHNQMIQDQLLARGIPLGSLISGHKKDVVVSNLLASNEGRIAIYGWHRGVGEPIQPLSTVHGAFYADYSHGIRLISDTILIDGKPESIYDVLRDPILAKLLSYEGVTPNPWGFSSLSQNLQARILSSPLER